MRNWRDPEEERELYRRAAAARVYIQRLAARTTPAQAQAVSDMRANYPWMRPGVAVPLAASGRPPDDPDVVEFARREAKRNKGRTGSWMGVGSVTGAPFSAFGDLAGFGVDALNWAGDLGMDILKPAARVATSAISAPLEEAQGVLRNVATALPGQSGEVTASALGGVAVGASIGSVIAPGPGTLIGGFFGGGLGALAGAFAPEVEGTPQWTSQSTFGRALIGQNLTQRGGQPFEGGFVSALGQGFLPSGPAARQQRDIAIAAGSINGQGVTPGRLIASAVLEPGSTPYNLTSGLLDASIALKADPGALALSRVGKARRAARSFTTLTKEEKAARAAVGLIEGPSTGIIAGNVERWLSTRDGVDTLGWLAREKDFEALRQALPRVDVETILDLRAANSADEVAQVLRPKLGLERGLTEKPRVGGMGASVRRTLQSRVRAFNAMPGGKIDFRDPTGAVEEFGRLQRNANFAPEVVSQNNRRMAELLVQGDTTEALHLVRNEFLGGTESMLAKKGVNPEALRRMNNRARRLDEAMARDFRQEIALTSGDARVGLGGKDTTLPLPGMLAEIMDNGVKFDLDDIRDMRRLTSRYSRVVSHPLWTTSVAGADWFMTEMWKPMQLIRGAWTTRVLGEEQARMAAADYESLFRHPLSYLSWVADDEGRIGRTLQRFRVKPRGTKGWEADEFVEAPPELEAALRGEANEYADALNRRRTTLGLQGKSLVETPHRVSLRPGEMGYEDALAGQLQQLNRDPFMRQLAEKAKRGKPLPAELSQRIMADESLRDGLTALAREPGGAGLMPLRDPQAPAGWRARDPQALEQWLDKRLRNVNQMAGKDQRLWEAVANGELDDVAMTLDNGRLNPEFVQALRSYTDTGVTPNSVLGDGWQKATLGDKYNRAMDSLFSGFMGTPQAVLSRSPVYRQELWRVAEDLIPELSKADQAKMLDAARGANLSRRQIARLEERAALASGDLPLQDAYLIGKARALDGVKGLLYDAAEKSNLSDVMRIIWPFAEAQKEVMTRWLRLSTDNPAIPYRATQIIEGARGAGFFTTDPQTGDEMFVYPGSELLTKQLLGTPIPLTGRVEGLNVFGSGILPGLGPVVQIPTRWLVPDKPEYDELRKFLDPFGQVGSDEGVLESHYPSWLRKVLTGISGPDEDRTFNNATFDIWRSGVSSGRYRTDTQEEIEEGLADAKGKARWLYVLRGAAQAFGAPVSPSPQFLAMDKDGRWLVADKLVEDYHKMADDEAAGGWETASARFLAKYGNNAFTWMQSTTYATGAAAPVSEEFAVWNRASGALAKKYPDTYALFGPQAQGEFDYPTYNRQFRTGEREVYTPEEAAKRANTAVARMIYHQAADRFGPHPSKPQREALQGIRALLRERFPGFDDPELPGAPSQEVVVEKFLPELRKAVEDPALADNEVAQVTRIYLAARDRLEAQAQAAGYTSFTQAKNLRPLRDALRDIGELLVDRVPAFQTTFDRVLDREMIDDGAEPEAELVTIGG